MEQLWAPWRSDYIATCDLPCDGCVFCESPKQENDKAFFILYRGSHVYVIMNKFPYNNGHLMAVPYRHVANPLELTEVESCELWKTILLCQKVVAEVMSPQGFNIGMNVGRPAGAGIDTHCHLHLVPRWNGDTNFIPVMSGVKVISEELPKTWERLKAAFETIVI